MKILKNICKKFWENIYVKNVKKIIIMWKKREKCEKNKKKNEKCENCEKN